MLVKQLRFALTGVPDDAVVLIQWTTPFGPGRCEVDSFTYKHGNIRGDATFEVVADIKE